MGLTETLRFLAWMAFRRNEKENFSSIKKKTINPNRMERNCVEQQTGWPGHYSMRHNEASCSARMHCIYVCCCRNSGAHAQIASCKGFIIVCLCVSPLDAINYYLLSGELPLPHRMHFANSLTTRSVRIMRIWKWMLWANCFRRHRSVAGNNVNIINIIIIVVVLKLWIWPWPCQNAEKGYTSIAHSCTVWAVSACDWSTIRPSLLLLVLLSLRLPFNAIPRRIRCGRWAMPMLSPQQMIMLTLLRTVHGHMQADRTNVGRPHCKQSLANEKRYQPGANTTHTHHTRFHFYYWTHL